MIKDEVIFKTLSNYKTILEEKGYKVLYVGLYGSQNYGLSDELSDIDAKAIILPSLHDIIFRTVTSKTIECGNGTIDVKDLITFYDVIKKGNFSYIESIDTEYSIGDKQVKAMFKQFIPNKKSILGAMYEKRKALTHEYPSKTSEFEKWGFDPKQYHHILRLYDLLLDSYGFDNVCKSYLTYSGETKANHIGIKRNFFNLEKNYVEAVSDNIIEKAKELIEEDYHYEPVNIDEEVSSYIENKIKIELIRNNNISYARQHRTFDGCIPKKDLEKFGVLKQYDGEDVNYVIYETLEIL